MASPLTEREFELRTSRTNHPKDPILSAVQQWLYDDTNLHILINTFASKNAANYKRDVDASLWPVSMTLLHEKFLTLLSNNLSEMLKENGWNDTDFEKSVQDATRSDVTSDDSTVVNLILAATDFRTFEIYLKDAHHQVEIKKRNKNKEQHEQYKAAGGKAKHGSRKHDIEHHL